MARTPLLPIAGLSLLLFALDRLYRWLHPEVNLVRASLVGLTALVVLLLLARLPRVAVHAGAGALAIFASACLSVILIESGALVSRSPLSGLVHVLILALAYPLLLRGLAPARRFTSSRTRPAATRASGPPRAGSSAGARR
jgi:hypothetical protein